MAEGEGQAATRNGHVYLVGAGPGDPGLLTIKGRGSIAKAEILIYDRLVSPELLNHAQPGCELIDAGKTPNNHPLPQWEINALLVENALAGKTVVRLKGGDSFVFGRGGEEAEALHAQGISFEVVPGVTSAVAAPAYAGIPVTHRGLASSFTVVTGHEDPQRDESSIAWEHISKTGGTLVFLMGMEKLPLIIENLLRQGMDAQTPAAIIEWGTWPKQRTLCGDIGSLVKRAKSQGFGNPSAIVVGQVVTLRDRLQWLERKPLLGRSIVVTRARHQVSTLARLLTDLGAEVWEVPVIRLASPTRPELLADVIRRLNAYRWLIFTSVNGVEAFFRELDAQDGDIRRLAGIELAAIGPATGDALAMRGLRGTVISEEYRAEGIVFALQGKIMPGDEVLLVRAEDARAVLPKLLREMGAAVTDAPAYRTVMADVNTAALTAALREGTIDAITFTSSSTARNLLSLLGENSDLLAGVRLCSIGPITSNTMRERGLEPSCQAEEYCIDGLVRAIVSSMGG